MPKTKFCAGISDISDAYMGFIIDTWGVLHDGQKAFDGAVDCLKELGIRKKQIILLTNSSKRAEDNKAYLKKFGIGPSLYHHIVTPGEVIFEGLSKQDDGIFKDLGSKCYVFSRGGDVSMLEDTGVEPVDNIDNADFVLISGSDFPYKGMDHYEPLIRKCIQKRLKAICPNMDSMAIISGGYMAGPDILARRYEDSGGIVHHIGKPHQLIFKQCVKLLQKKDVYPAQTVMLGDTMGNDVLGGHAAGLDTCLVKSGLHAANFRHCQNLKEVNNALKNLMAQYNNIMPSYLMDEFKWGKALPDRKHKKRKQPGS